MSGATESNERYRRAWPSPPRARIAAPGALLIALIAALASVAAPATGKPANVPLAWSSSGSVDYGTLDAARGQTASQTFTLSNADGRNSGLVEVALSGSSAFAITADGCTGERLTRRKSCGVTVTYAPTANGSHSATLVASGPSAENASVALTGASAWQQGDLVTYNQNDWGDSTTAAGVLLNTNFTSFYGSSLVVGGTHTITFTSASSVFSYLPALGTAGVLSGSLQNPTLSSAGELGGEVVALQINVDFSDADLLANTTPLGDLRFCNFTALPVLNGQTVRQFLATANTILGGGSGPFGPTTAAAVARLINNAFLAGTPSTFAQATLQPGACP